MLILFTFTLRQRYNHLHNQMCNQIIQNDVMNIFQLEHSIIRTFIIILWIHYEYFLRYILYYSNFTNIISTVLYTYYNVYYNIIILSYLYNIYTYIKVSLQWMF